MPISTQRLLTRRHVVTRSRYYFHLVSFSSVQSRYQNQVSARTLGPKSVKFHYRCWRMTDHRMFVLFSHMRLRCPTSFSQRVRSGTRPACFFAWILVSTTKTVRLRLPPIFSTPFELHFLKALSQIKSFSESLITCS